MGRTDARAPAVHDDMHLYLHYGVRKTTPLRMLTDAR